MSEMGVLLKVVLRMMSMKLTMKTPIVLGPFNHSITLTATLLGVIVIVVAVVEDIV